MEMDLEELVLAGIFLDENNDKHNINEINELWFLSYKNRDFFKKLKKEKENGLMYDLAVAIEHGFTPYQLQIMKVDTEYLQSLYHRLPSYISELKQRYAKYGIHESSDPKEIIELTKLFETKKENRNIFNFQTDMSKYSDYLEDLMTNKIKRISWGFENLDRVAGLIQEGNFITIGGRTSTGKTSFMLNMAYSMVKKNIKCLYLTAEMTPFELVNRIITKDTNVKLYDIFNNNLTKMEKKELTDKMTELTKYNLMFYENAKFNIQDIKSLFKQYNFEVLYLDYLQKFKISNEADTRASGYADIVDELKELALQEKKIIIAGSQLSRDVEHRATNEPVLSDLKESGGIEESSDKVGLLQIMDTDNPDIKSKLEKEKVKYQLKENEKLIKLKIAKNRQGLTFNAYFIFTGHDCNFSEI